MENMNKFFDLIIQTIKGKNIQRILQNWKIAEHCQNLKGVIIDLGSGKNPSYQRYWKIFPSKFITIDIDKNNEPDIIADINKPLPLGDNFADVVFLFNVIYIIEKPEKLIKEIFRILKDGGIFFFYFPFIFNESKEPDDYIRFTSQSIERLLKNVGFKEYQIISVGERFTAAVDLIDRILIFNILKIPLRIIALFLDWVWPKKLKQFHPCPMGYFVKGIK